MTGMFLFQKVFLCWNLSLPWRKRKHRYNLSPQSCSSPESPLTTFPTQTCPFWLSPERKRQNCHTCTEHRNMQKTSTCQRWKYFPKPPTHRGRVCFSSLCSTQVALFANPPCQWPSEEPSQTLHSQTPLYSQRTEHLSSDSYDFQLNFLFCWNMDHLLHHAYFCIINLLACWNHS